MTQVLTAVDGIGLDDDTARGSHPGVLSGFKLKWLGQTANTVASNIANQGIGTIAIPALAAGATTTLTINDSLITTTSLVFTQVCYGSTPPTDGQAIPLLVTKAPGAGSVVVVAKNSDGTNAIAANNYALRYWVVN